MALAEQNELEVCDTMAFDPRLFTRVPFVHPVRWENGQGETGAASLQDLSRGGMRISLARYLRPGPVLRIVFDDIEYGGRPIELQTLIVWCEPDSSASDRFVAGLSIVHGAAETLGSVSEVFYAALHNRRAPSV